MAKTTDPNKMTESELKKSRKYQADRDAEKVKGVFHYHERPGQTLKFDYSRFGNEKQTHWELTDGKTYELPRGVARHLMNSGFRNVYEWYKDERGDERMRLARKVRRYSWEHLDFFELDDLGKQHDLVTEVKL